jgi:hypothetical protein
MLRRAVRAAALVMGPLSLAGHAAARPSALKKSSDALGGAKELHHLGSTGSPAGEKGCGQPRKGFIGRKAPYVSNQKN